MERRKFVVGLGALASGSAAAMGTGAFTSVEADRDVDVTVAGDAAAYLALSGDNSSVSQYVDSDPSSGQLVIDLSSSNSNTTGDLGDGVNPEAVTLISNLFQITNQGTQDIGVYIDKNGNDSNNEVSFFVDGDTDGEVDSGESIEGSGNSQTLTPGNSVSVSLEIDTTSGTTAGNDIFGDTDEITIYGEQSQA